jgi:hypothetical protein
MEVNENYLNFNFYDNILIIIWILKVIKKNIININLNTLN